jgi:O-antigen/teichoic acid export membrane protein
MLILKAFQSRIFVKILKGKELPKGIQNSIWSVLDAALYPVFYMATVPIMMRSLGVVLFGLWIILSSLITIFQLLNLNLSITAMRSVSAELSSDDESAVTEVINSLIYITSVLFIIAIICGIFLSETAVKYGWWGLKDLSGTNVVLCIFLASVLAGLKYFDQVFQSILKAKEAFKLASVLNIVNRFGLLLINLAMAVNGFSISDILLADIVFGLLFFTLQFISVKRTFIFYRLKKVRSKSQHKELLRFSIWPWLQSLFIILTFQTDRFWVSSFAGLKEVSLYGLISTMFNHIHIIFTAMAIWMLPRISAMLSKNEDPAELYLLVRKGLLSFIILSLLFFYLIAPIIFPIWIGAENYINSQQYIRAFVCFEIVFAHTILPVIYLNASGNQRLATLLTFIYCAVCYAFMMLGLWVFKSPVALVEGMAISMCITMPIVNFVSLKVMRSNYNVKQAIFEMMPMYAAILLLYTHNIYALICLLIIAAFFLWKFYLSALFNKYLWKPAKI